MIYLLIISLLITGLYLLWTSLASLCRLEWKQAHAPAPEPPSEENDDEQPRLTRLGRPVEEIRLSA